jgi:type IX secretion system PorP/SprF family membrane protein
MKYLRITLSVLALLAYSLTVECQQTPTFSQYIMNGFLINPAVTGRDGFTSVNLTARDQWIGIKGGPATYAASFQTNLSGRNSLHRSRFIKRKSSRYSKAGRVGLGGYLFNDNNGIIRRTGFQVDYAYHVPLLSTSRMGQDDLAFGLSMTTYQFAINTSDLQGDYSDDLYFTNYDKAVFVTDFNTGVCYTNSKFYAGFSMTNILRGSLIYANGSDNKRGELGHYYLTGGMNFAINREWSVKPSLLLKSSDILLKSMQADITARVFYQELYWAGLSYRTSDAIVYMMGFRYDLLYIGTAYDFTLTEIRNKSFGSIEVTIAVKFGESSGRFKWLNIF